MPAKSHVKEAFYDKKTGEEIKPFGYELDSTGKPMRSKLPDLKPGEDIGADPLGDGKFKMVPSGDVVDSVEKERRLARFRKNKYEGVVKESKGTSKLREWIRTEIKSALKSESVVNKKNPLTESYKAGVKTPGDNDWVYNSLRFATEQEADEYVNNLAMRWTQVRDTHVEQSNDPVNYKWENGSLKGIKEGSTMASRYEKGLGAQSRRVDKAIGKSLSGKGPSLKARLEGTQKYKTNRRAHVKHGKRPESMKEAADEYAIPQTFSVKVIDRFSSVYVLQDKKHPLASFKFTGERSKKNAIAKAEKYAADLTQQYSTKNEAAQKYKTDRRAHVRHGKRPENLK